jgi:hypothetical protein
LVTLMNSELDDKEEALASEFQNMMFGHAVMHDNRDLFFHLYPMDGMAPEEEAELDWVVPQTEGDIQAMMNELRAVGGIA